MVKRSFAEDDGPNDSSEKNSEKVNILIFKSFLYFRKKAILNDILGGRGSNSALMNTTDVHNKYFVSGFVIIKVSTYFKLRFGNFLSN